MEFVYHGKIEVIALLSQTLVLMYWTFIRLL